MVKVKTDLTGMVFGRLCVISQAEDYINPTTEKHSARWLCKCSCTDNNHITVDGGKLKNGETQSCGCLRKENLKRISSMSNRKGNKHDLSGEYGILWTNNTNQEVYFDLDDAGKILQYTWVEDDKGYPHARVGNRIVRMHTLLGYHWNDHKNRNKMDNRRENFRPCTYRTNDMNRSVQKNNTSGIIGVNFNKVSNSWMARISNESGKRMYLGCYSDMDAAIRARLSAEAKYYGEFAPQRHLFEQYNINVNIGDSDG